MTYRSTGLFLLALVLPHLSALADTTDISNAPLASSSSSIVKPNIMFILDDSKSMAMEFLPDVANFGWGNYGTNSSHCNGMYYDPTVTYSPPVDSYGTSYPDASFTNAWLDGFNTGAGTKNLTNSSYYVYIGSQPDLAFTYKTSGWNTGNVIKTSPFYTECSTGQLDKGGGAAFKAVKVTSTSGPNGTDERTNFANWYSYYRSRILMMKTAAGRAFKNIDSNYRVGYSTIGYTGTSDSDDRYLSIADFTQAQKDAWYSKLYKATPSGNTPLRQALSKAGRNFAGQIGTDPVQYSCQQNFAILSTDGFWNSPTPGYQINGTSGVGNVDGAAVTPMLDALNVADTLADVAYYYYYTDLRTPASGTWSGNCIGALGSGYDVCENNVPGAGADTNNKQHMTTFTLGLGTDGTLHYQEDYLSASTGDYHDISQGSKVWPKPISNEITTVDDLWHAAVNGHGTYFTAKNPQSLVSGISKALAGVSARTGSAAAAATSNLEPVAGDNYVYIALYRTQKWDGDLQAKTIDPSTGEISSTPTWAAQSLLDGKASANSDTRTIYTFDDTVGNTTKLKAFTWANLTTAEKAYFNDMCGATVKLSQCATLTATQQTDASGANLVNFIRGQSGYEDQTGNTERLYRDREHVLGDMISSQPVYVKVPPFNYSDPNYSVFRDTTQSARAARVYVADNDGMLHAFDGDNGQEQWAYIPPMVMPKLYKLADVNYANNHQFFVDGSPTVGDICPNAPASTCSGSQWKTILVGGLNAGGKGYYALDITDPSNPKALWNFTSSDDADLGYTFGNPIITKRHDGTWVVVFTSGYNNAADGSNGVGYLYVLNANTGAVLEKITAPAGSTTFPSGLAKINAWIDSTTDNTAQRFYGGDMQGNVWRFDTDDVVAPTGKEAFLLAELGKINGAGTQPVTTKPELTEVASGGATHAVVSVATGRYLGQADLTDQSQQSIYTFKDDLTGTGLGEVRSAGVLVKQTLSTFTSKSGQEMRTTSANPVDWATNSGWYVDLNPGNESPGERVNVDMQQQLGLLTVAANVPNANACNVGGYAWLYYFDYKTGQYVQTAAESMAGVRLTNNSLVAGIKTIKLTTGKTVTIITDTGGGISGNGDPSSNPGSGSGVKRVSWRELTQ